MGVNTESLARANAFLAAVAARVRPGEFLQGSPADIGREIGFEQPLVAARAVRALLARGRLEAVDGRYRLIDPRPVQPGERETVKRPPRARRAKERPEPAPEAGEERVTYSAVGREMVERLIELGREVATLRANLRAAREEAREAREARDEAERRAQTLANRVRELEARADMAETNLRNVLAAARGAGRDVVGDSEMEAILGVLKGESTPPREPT